MIQFIQLLLIISAITFCLCEKNHDNQHYPHPVELINVAQLSFNDGDSMTVCTDIETNLIIDSIHIIRKEINALLEVHGRQRMFLHHLEPLRKTNPDIYDRLSSINTRYSLRTTDSVYRFFGNNAFSDSISFGNNNYSTVFLSIYSLYSAKIHIGNLLFIDSCNAPPPNNFCQKLIFDNNDTLIVYTGYHVDRPIDSIAIVTKTFSGNFISLGRGDIDYQKFRYLEKHNPAEYQALKSILTACSIRSNSTDYYISAKKGTYDNIKMNTEVRVTAEILQLFSQDVLWGNMIIIDKIEPLE